MPKKTRRKSLAVGDRVRDKLTGRTGAITNVNDAGRQPTYAMSYDEAPQDHHITTPSKAGAERPEELLEAER